MERSTTTAVVLAGDDGAATAIAAFVRGDAAGATTLTGFEVGFVRVIRLARARTFERTGAEGVFGVGSAFVAVKARRARVAPLRSSAKA